MRYTESIGLDHTGSPKRRRRRWPWVLVFILAALTIAAGVDLYRFLYGTPPILAAGVSPSDLAVSPDGRMIYLANSTDSITPVSAVTGEVGKPIAISGGSPGYLNGGLAITPDGRTLFVTVTAGHGPDSSSLPLARVDLRTGRETGQVQVPGGVSDFVMSGDGKTLYVVSGNGQLYAVNAVTDRAERHIPAPQSLLEDETAMVLSPDGGTLYVATMPVDDSDTVGDSVTGIDLRTGSVRQAVDVGSEPVSLAITPDGRTLYVAIDGMEGGIGQVNPNYVKVIDTATWRVTASLPWQAPPMYLQVVPDGKTVWVASSSALAGPSTSANTVTPVTVADNKPGPSFRTAGWLDPSDGPEGMTISPDGQAIYVTVPSGLETFRTQLRKLQRSR